MEAAVISEAERMAWHMLRRSGAFTPEQQAVIRWDSEKWGRLVALAEAELRGKSRR